MGLLAAPAGSSVRGSYPDLISPLREDYNAAIQSALKVDHQIYTDKKLSPFLFGDIPSLPGITNIFTTPFEAISNLLGLVKGKLRGQHPSKIQAGIKIASSTISFANATLTALKYIVAVKAFIVLGVAITPIILVTGFIISCLEISVHAYRYKKGRDFQKLFTHNLFKPLFLLKSAASENYVNKPKLQRLGNDLLKEVEKYEKKMKKEYGNTYVETLIRDLESLIKNTNENSKKTSEQNLELISKITDDFQRNFCLRTMENIDREFMTIDDQKQTSILNKANTYFDKMPYEKALENSLDKIQNNYIKRKARLAQRTEPWIAAEYSNKYQGLLQNIKSEDKTIQKEAFKTASRLLLKMNATSEIGQTLHLISIAAFGLILGSYALSILLPMITAVPIIFMVAATVYSFIYYLLKKGMSESQTNSFDYKNCIPSWIKWIGKKLSTSQAEAQRRKIEAVDFTEIVQKQRRSA